MVRVDGHLLHDAGLDVLLERLHLQGLVLLVLRLDLLVDGLLLDVVLEDLLSLLVRLVSLLLDVQ